jgi:capsular polysaccharide biosynthesis protein
VLTKDLDLNKKVHRIFSQTYRYISLFAMEQCYNQIQQVVLGGNGKQKVLVNGDLIYSMGLVCTFPAVTISQQLLDTVNYPTDTQRFTLRRFSYVTNFGPSLVQKATFYIQSTAIDQNSDINSIILNRLFQRVDQREYYDFLIGHRTDLTTM